jgi:N-acetylglucosaminyldiphosphoundecaprenol N-acetyl-beta-D-mannosaminyltransferase
MHPSHQLPSGEVLGVPVHLADYDSAVSAILAMAHDGQTHAVAAANTHLIGEAAVNPDFAAVLCSFDLVVPDGMPLVWSLRQDGHSIRDRIYGPYLMARVLAASGAETRHFFLGGTEETLSTLSQRLWQLHPHLNIAGTLSPPFGRWTPQILSDILQTINAAKPHCIWVALGGVKQETWIHQVRPQIHSGVMLAVGDAFVLNAGLRSYAPAWLQRLGLTWLYRLLQEPRRLAARYAQYHLRFVGAYLAHRWRQTWGQLGRIS